MNALDLLPASWRSELAGASIHPVRTGAGGAFVFRVERAAERRFLKIAAGQQAEDLREEIARTAWLGSQGIKVSAILRSVTDVELAAVLMAALEGEPVEDADRHHRGGWAGAGAATRPAGRYLSVR